MPVDQNFINAVHGHIAKLEGEEKGGEKPSKPEDTQSLPLKNKPQSEYDLDVRDILTAIAGKGWEGISKDDKPALINRLEILVGKQESKKVLNHLLVFSQREDQKNKTPEQRIETFYNVGSSDKYVNDIIERSKSLGYGVMEGNRTSSDVLNKEISHTKIGDKPADSKAAKVEEVAKSVIPQ